MFSAWGAFIYRFRRPVALLAIIVAIASGSLSLGPITVYRLADVRRAHDDLEHNRTLGKLVLAVDDEAPAPG